METESLASQWWEGVTDATGATDSFLAANTSHGLLYWTGVGVVIVGAVALARYGINKITGKNNSVGSVQESTRSRVGYALGAQ